MTRKGFRVLETLSKDFQHLIDFVVIGSDESVQNDYYLELRGLCERLGVHCYDRMDAYDVTSQYSVAISWRWMINLKETRLIVFHDSLLPKYRGFNPLVSCLINGERRIGVTAVFASEDYDKGDIIAQASSEISYPIKIEEAIEIVSENYAALAGQIAAEIAADRKLCGKRQNERQASYSLWRGEEDYRIDWTRSAEEIQRSIDAAGFPYKGASTLIDDKLARIFQAEAVEDVKIENRTPGKVIFIKNSQPIVVCGSGLLKIIVFIDDKTGESLLPLRSFRTKLK